MAYMNQTLSGLQIGARIDTALSELRDRMARRATYRQTIRELSDLTARDLADLGIHRSAIRRIAYEAAYGSK